MLKRAWGAFLTLNPTARLITAAVTVVLAVALVFGVYKGLWYVFGGREAIKAHAQTKVEQAHTQAVQQIGGDVANRIIERDTYRTEVDHTVVEGQHAIEQVDHGQQMDPAIDAATADALCKLHNDLCRGTDTDQVH